MRRWTISMVVSLFALVVAGEAIAAAPSVTTLPATGVTNTGARLNGAVVPGGEATTYFFEYGPTEAFGVRTPVRSAGSGTSAKQVARTIGSLTPATTYYFRLVASNASGSVVGGTVTFTTPAPGQVLPTPTVKLSASPDPSRWGRQTSITATLSNFTTNVGQTVELRESVYPYASGFSVVGSTTSDASGKAVFLRVPAFNTIYQAVVTGPGPDIASETHQLLVRPLVTFYASDTTPRSGQIVRLNGSVVTGHDGQLVYIQRRSSTGRYATVARARLKPVAGETRSVYSRSIRINSSSTYRAYLKGHEDHTNGLAYRTLKVH